MTFADEIEDGNDDEPSEDVFQSQHSVKESVNQQFQGYMSPRSQTTIYDDDDPNLRQPILEVDGILYDQKLAVD